MKKTLASLLSAALIILSPGLAAYAAAGEMASSGAGARISVPLALPAVSPISGPASSFNSVAPGLPSLTLPGAAIPAGVSAPSAAAASAANAANAANASAALTPAAQAAAAAAAPTAPAAGLPQPGAARAPGAPGLNELVSQQSQLSLTADQAAAMPTGQARETGASIMDRVLGLTSRLTGRGSVLAAPGAAALSKTLAPAGARDDRGGSFQPPAPPSNGFKKGDGNGNGPRGGKFVGALATLGRVIAGAALVLGLQAAGVALLPAIFGLTPVAAVWAVSSGVILLPAALFARYRLALRDSPRLSKVKWVLDGAIGAFIGAALVAAPALGLVLATQGAAIGLPLAVIAGAGSLVSILSGGRAVDALLAGGALAAIPAVVGVSAGIIGLAPLLGMMALPVMTTIAFFLGQIINAAETGRPFSVPGSLQKLRFPSFNWVMIGVVFALTTGFGAVHANIAFMIWQFTGNKGMPTWNKKLPVLKNVLGLLTNFNVLYLGLLAFTAATAFTSPLTFIVIAFAGERASVWTEGLLGKLLPASEAAPSSLPDAKDAPQTLSERVERKWPAFHHWAKTGILLGTMAVMAFGMGYWIVGIGSLVKNLGVAAALTALPLFLSKFLIKKVMKLQPATPQSDPEFYEIMTEMRAKINENRAAKGKAPINMPELAISPTDLPNAAATGLSPNKSLVFVTQGIKQMLLEPEDLRDGLVRLLAGFPVGSDEFKVFRTGLVGTIPGVTQQSTPQEAAQAVVRASPAQLKTLGKRLLRGVLSHEFSHVMDRHMITGTIGGALSSGVAFASYGVMWAVGHAKMMATQLKDRILGRVPKVIGDDEQPGSDFGTGKVNGAKPEMLEPLSTGIVLKSLPALLRVFAALWAPIIMQITQMAGSRNNEAQADEDGALLSQDPAALALALGLLTTWRPKQFAISGLQLPRLAAVSHMMTVNPLLQLQKAGALPKNDLSGPPVSKADNFLLDLFMTHPDTLWRIRTLKKMADALGQDKNPPDGGQPPPGGGGGRLAQLEPKSAPAQSRGVSFAARAFGAVRGAWNSIVVVLPDPARNREFWKFTWGQAFANIGASFHYAALSKLLAPKPEDSKRVTDNRAINSAAQLGASVLTGPLVDHVSPRTILVATYLGRAALMALVPILFFHGYFVVAAFHLIIFAAGFLQATSMTAGSVAFQRILGEDERVYNKANAVFTVVLSATGILAPLAAGAFIVAMDARLGFLAGNALAYGVYASLLLATGLLYLTLRVPRGPPRAEGAEAPQIHSLGARLRELVDGFRLIWRSRFLKIYLLFTTFSVMMADPIVFSALPRYLADVLKLDGAHQGAAFSWYLAAASAGTALASLAMMFLKTKKEAPPAAGGLTQLQKQGRWSSILHGLSWLLYVGLFFSHSLPLSIGFMVASMVCAAPAMTIWSSLLQKAIADETPRDMGKVYASLFFYQLAFAIVGSLLFGWLMMHVPTLLALKIAAGVMALMAGLDALQPFLIFKKPKPGAPPKA